MTIDTNLLGHWPLDDDLRNHSSHDLACVGRGLVFGDCAGHLIKTDCTR